MENSRKIIATHNGTFHADDVFAVATLLLIYPDAKVIRTRDEEDIARADIVVDVGGQSNGENFFDHHQEGGAGKRDNGIPYASFGLVWKKYGGMISGIAEADIVDNALVSAIDAIDSGVSLSAPIIRGTFDYSFTHFVISMNPLDSEVQNHDEVFNDLIHIAQKAINREVAFAKELIGFKEVFYKTYEKSEDKRILVLDNQIRKNIFYRLSKDLADIYYAVSPNEEGMWSIRCARKNEDSFESKKPFPASWAGKRGKDLEEASGVYGAHFCHNGRFIASAKTRDGAIEMAKKALEA